MKYLILSLLLASCSVMKLPVNTVPLKVVSVQTHSKGVDVTVQNKDGCLYLGRFQAIPDSVKAGVVLNLRTDRFYGFVRKK